MAIFSGYVSNYQKVIITCKKTPLIPRLNDLVFRKDFLLKTMLIAYSVGGWVGDDSESLSHCGPGEEGLASGAHWFLHQADAGRGWIAITFF